MEVGDRFGGQLLQRDAPRAGEMFFLELTLRQYLDERRSVLANEALYLLGIDLNWHTVPSANARGLSRERQRPRRARKRAARADSVDVPFGPKRAPLVVPKPEVSALPLYRQREVIGCEPGFKSWKHLLFTVATMATLALAAGARYKPK
jgi:hypothetical protein